MAVDQESWERRSRAYEARFVDYGPFWQAECNWCSSMSDCFDHPQEAEDWKKDHRCEVTIRVERR